MKLLTAIFHRCDVPFDLYAIFQIFYPVEMIDSHHHHHRRRRRRRRPYNFFVVITNISFVNLRGEKGGMGAKQ